MVHVHLGFVEIPCTSQEMVVSPGHSIKTGTQLCTEDKLDSERVKAYYVF